MKPRGQGREKLIEAARLEFEDHGYDGTNSNAIARRADFAPQTFYRHFADKRAVFLTVYQAWAAAAARDLSTAATPQAIAEVLIQHHRSHRIFRRSLRALTVSDPGVGKARAEARLQQMQNLAGRTKISEPAHLLAGILKIERLSDAIADGEFVACGINEEDAVAELLSAVEDLFSSPKD